MPSKNSERQWQHWLTRAFHIFSSSLYAKWYSSESSVKLFGCSVPDVLLVEEYPNLTRIYRDRNQLHDFHAALEAIVREEPERAEAILGEGCRLYDLAERYLASSHPFADLDAAERFYYDYTAHAIIFAFFTHKIFEGVGDLSRHQKVLLELSEHLRRQPLYEALMTHILLPLARRHLKERGYENVDASLLSIREIAHTDASVLYEHRLRERKNGKHFIYQFVSGNETIELIEAATIPSRIEAIEPEYTQGLLVQELRGTSAYPGKVLGRVRLILSTNPHVAFDTGDVLVSVNSDPSLMPLIVRSSALVTDEGGMMCHAAIVSRELKKPCVIGTKKATRVFRDGDLVEVDAEKGIVRKI